VHEDARDLFAQGVETQVAKAGRGGSDQDDPAREQVRRNLSRDQAPDRHDRLVSDMGVVDTDMAVGFRREHHRTDPHAHDPGRPLGNGLATAADRLESIGRLSLGDAQSLDRQGRDAPAVIGGE
jgi:hypothetical protein